MGWPRVTRDARMEGPEPPSVATWSIAHVAGWVQTLDEIEDAVGLAI